MKAWTIPVIVMLSLLFLVNSGSAETVISACQTLSSADTYILDTDITDYVGTCFTINANDIVLDCGNHIVDGDDTSTDYGVYIYKVTTALTNVTVVNCQLTDFYYGIYSRGISESAKNVDMSFFNISANSNTRYGVYSRFNENNVLNNISASTNYQATTVPRGIYLESSNGNTIENVRLENNGLFVSSSSIIITIPSHIDGFYALNGSVELSNMNLTVVENGFIEKCVSNSSIGFFAGTSGTYNSVFRNITVNDSYACIMLMPAYNTSYIDISANNCSSPDISIVNSKLSSNNISSDCDTIVFDNVVADGRQFLFVNDTVDINGWNNISGIFLCDADNSQIRNLDLSYVNSDIFSLSSVFSNIVNITNVINKISMSIYTSENVYVNNVLTKTGVLSVRSGNLNINNFTVTNSYGRCIDTSSFSVNSIIADRVNCTSEFYNDFPLVNIIVDDYAVITNSTFYTHGGYSVFNANYVLNINPTFKVSGVSLNAPNYGNTYEINISNSHIHGNVSALGLVTNDAYATINIVNSVLESENTNMNGTLTLWCFYTIGGVLNTSKCFNSTVVNLYNTTLTNYYINDSTMNVYWKLMVNNILSADVSIKNVTNDEVASFSNSCDVWLQQYGVTSGNVRTESTPHNITASKIGYVTNSTDVEMTTNKEYTVSFGTAPAPPTPPIINSFPDIFVQLVLTLGFGIIAIFACLTLIVSKEDVQVLYQPENFIKLIIAVAIVILMLVGVWQGLVL